MKDKAMTIDASVGKRISMLRTLLILLIVFLHTGGPSLEELDYSNYQEVIRFAFQDLLGRLGVPTLTVISGYLLFSSKLDLTPLKMYKKKFMTLAIPFFFFNVLYFAVQYGLEYFTGIAPLYALVEKPAYRLVNYLVSYNGMPLNEALHFLRDMMVLVFLTPLFSFFLRRFPVVGFILVMAIFMNNLDHTVINRNTMAVLFYVGGWAATSKFDMTKFDQYGKHALALLVLVGFMVMYFRVQDYTYVYLVAPFTVWPATALLVNTKVGNWLAANSKYSFFLFLAHTPLLRVLDLLNHKFLDGNATLVFVVGSFFIVVPTLVIAYDLAVKYMPNVFCFMIGGRSEKKSRKVTGGNQLVAKATA